MSRRRVSGLAARKAMSKTRWTLALAGPWLVVLVGCHQDTWHRDQEASVLRGVRPPPGYILVRTGVVDDSGFVIYRGGQHFKLSTLGVPRGFVGPDTSDAGARGGPAVGLGSMVFAGAWDGPSTDGVGACSIVAWRQEAGGQLVLLAACSNQNPFPPASSTVPAIGAD
jgi:hypothetical protein